MIKTKRLTNIFLIAALVFFTCAGTALAGFDDEEETDTKDTGSTGSTTLTSWASQTSDEVQPVTSPLAKNMPYLFLIGGVSILMYYGLKSATEKDKGHLDSSAAHKNSLHHAGWQLLLALVFIAIFIAFAKGDTVGIM